MVRHSELTSKQLQKMVRTGKITFGGNRKLKIYGTLHCKFGKRMKTENRVFFSDQSEARGHGYRPCGHCMRSDYLKWKDEVV